MHDPVRSTQHRTPTIMWRMFAPRGTAAGRRILFTQILLLLALLLAACSNAGSADRSVATSDLAPREKSRTEVATPIASAGKETIEEISTVEEASGETASSSGVAFVAHPKASGGLGHQADTILAVRYGVHRGYERLVLDLGTGEQTAETVPEWTLMRPIDDLILRVTLPSISDTVTSDGRFGDSLLKSFYVVRAPNRGMFVDIFARRAFVYRVLELSDPARLVVDFKPGGAPPKAPPPEVGGNTVLVEPRTGARIENPLTISGYSRNFEASNEVILADPEGEILIRRTIWSNDWSATWGYFEATLNLPSYDGKATLRVGARSARDGTFEGAEVPIHVSR